MPCQIDLRLRFATASCLQFVEEGIGFTQSRSYLVTEDGYEPICAPGDIPFFVVWAAFGQDQSFCS